MAKLTKDEIRSALQIANRMILEMTFTICG